jgi:hypothetical protein
MLTTVKKIREAIKGYDEHHKTDYCKTVPPAETKVIPDDFFAKHGKKLPCIKVSPKLFRPNLCVQKNLVGVA